MYKLGGRERKYSLSISGFSMGAFRLEVMFNEQHRQSYQLLTMKHLIPTTED